MYAKTEGSRQSSRGAAIARRDHSAERFDSVAARIRYRTAVTRHCDPKPAHSYYDGGDLSPYSIESLLDLLRAESRQPYSWLEVDVEINGPCPAAVLRDLTLRFSALSMLGLKVRVRAEGHAPFLISTKNRSS